MAGTKRDRQRAARQAQLAAAAAARRRAERRRNVIRGAAVSVVALALIGAVIAVVSSSGSPSKKVAAATPTSAPAAAPATTSTTPASAAGKPCVGVVSPYPAGAPQVPVKLGPPPPRLGTEDIKPGNGAVVTAGQTITVNYIGVACSTGKIFDSSYGTGKQPATFSLAQVIKGWQNGIPGMMVGGQRLLAVPPALAYGADGYPPDIAPNETLWFVVDVVKAA